MCGWEVLTPFHERGNGTFEAVTRGLVASFGARSPCHVSFDFIRSE